MGRALGLRAEAQQVHWAVVEGTQQTPILVDRGKAAAPADVDEAAALSALRDRILLVIRAQKPECAIVRAPEHRPRGGNSDGDRRRLRLEGVLLQAADSACIKTATWAHATISARLGSTTSKAYVESGLVRGIDVSRFPLPAKEAVLVAVAGLPKQ